jgi:hypothetical protein
MLRWVRGALGLLLVLPLGLVLLLGCGVGGVPSDTTQGGVGGGGSVGGVPSDTTQGGVGGGGSVGGVPSDTTQGGVGGGGSVGGVPSDTTPPSINDVQVTPSQFRFAGGEATISAQVSDPSGIAEVWAEVQKPDGTRERVGMSSVGGVYQGRYQIGANTSTNGQPQVYRVWVRARDGRGNETPSPGMPSSGVVVTVQAPMSPPSQPSFP